MLPVLCCGGLGGEIAFVVIRLEGFMQVKLTCPGVVLRSQVIIKSHDPVVFLRFIQKFIIFNRLAIKDKKSDIGPGEDFSLYGQHHIVVGRDLIGDILTGLDIQNPQAPVLIDLTAQPDPSQYPVLDQTSCSIPGQFYPSGKKRICVSRSASETLEEVAAIDKELTFFRKELLKPGQVGKNVKASTLEKSGFTVRSRFIPFPMAILASPPTLRRALDSSDV